MKLFDNGFFHDRDYNYCGWEEIEFINKIYFIIKNPIMTIKELWRVYN